MDVAFFTPLTMLLWIMNLQMVLHCLKCQ